MKRRPVSTRREPAKDVASRRQRAPTPVFPVVGIGASAGGLEALEQFLRRVPVPSTMGFVIVQHLDPTHTGMLAELLQRASALPVVQVTDRTRVEPGHVYVIPPNKDMSIVHGVLHLLVPVAPRGLRLPIDFFFRSLAEDQHERGMGVILSGMGSDGTLGFRAIRENAGATFVQTPASAKFSGMPRSAIDAGLADVVAEAEDLPGKISEYLQHAHHIARPEPLIPDSQAESGLEKIIGLLRSAAGHDFSHYKRSTLHRRIERRMGLHQITDIARYVRYLRENPKEADLLFKELLIGVTGFFRDPTAWERLKDDVLPALLTASSKGTVLRAWVPACSTGEEAYSLGIVFKEALEQGHPSRNVRLQIFATDLDATAVDKARQGLYPANIATEVSPERLNRFFVEEERGYRVRQDIRDLVVFATQNILQDPPFTKLDLLACRNLLIYLSPEVQQKLIPLFHYSLNPRGFLFLGGAETVGTFSRLFAPLNGKTRLYRRLEPTAGSTASTDFPSVFTRTPQYARGAATLEPSAAAARTPNLQSMVEQLLLTRFAPTAVLAGNKGDVLYVSGRTGKYLELPAGKANWNVFAMAKDGLHHALGAAFHKALGTMSTQVLTGLPLRTDGHGHAVDVTLVPIDEPAALRGTVMIVFSDAPALPGVAIRGKAKGSPARVAAVARLEEQLEHAREELRSRGEEMQTSEEELKSANEELQSTNEELQSTNEELTTSKEEMQSMNEELQTLNHELQAKVDDLSRASNDMKNLLDSTEIAIVFLDEALNVRRFTPQATTIFKLIPGDVGRPLADLASHLAYPDLYDDAREVLRTLAFKEKAAVSRNGRWLKVRIMPYRTSDNRIDGVVMTLTNIGAPGTLEAKRKGES